MADDPWAGFEEVAPAAAPTFPGVIPGRVSPARQAAEQRAQAGDARDATRTDLAVRGEQRQEQNTSFDNLRLTRNDYNSDPTVKAYRVAIQQLGQAVATGEGPQADLALTYAFAKAMDPESVVRESEQGMVTDSQPWFQSMVERTKKQFGMDGAGNYTPEARRNLREQIASAVAQRNKAYIARREYYRQFAERNGIDPQDVIGAHDGAPFLPALQEFEGGQQDNREQAAAGAPAPSGAAATPPGGAVPPANDPQMRGGLPVGTEIQWDADTPTRAFDRKQYLQEHYGITDNQEALTTGFWNANSGNADLTPESVRAWYEGHNLAVPADPEIARGIANAKAGKRFGGIDTSRAQADYEKSLDAANSRRGIDPNSVSGAVDINFGQGVTLGGLDEFNGVVGGIKAGLTGESPAAGYQVERDLTRRYQEQTQEAHPYVSLGSEIGGGVVTGGVGFTEPLRVGALARQAAAIGDTARAASLGQRAVTSAARSGALTGAVAGFNNGEGLVGSTAGGVLGAGGGAVLGAGAQAVAPYIGKGLNALTRRPVMAPEELSVIQAGERIGVSTRAPDVRPDLRQARANVLSEAGAPGQMVRNADTEDRAAMEAARSNIAPGNAAPDAFAAGERTQAAINRELKNTRGRAGRQYDIATQASGGATFKPTEAIATADSEIARLRSEGASDKLISYMEGLRTKLDRAEGWTPMQLHALRADLRKNLSAEGLPAEAAELPAMRAIDAATTDMTRELAGNSKALRAMQAGDRIWRERAQFRREVSDTLFGKARNFSPDQTGRALESMVRNDHQRTAALFEKLDPDERADLAATFVERLGNDNNGKFSFARFLSQTEGKGALVSPRSMRLLFGEDGMRALADMRTVAQSKVAAADRTNWSGTGGVAKSGLRGLRMTLFALLGMSSGGPAGAVLAPAADSFVQRMGAKRMARLLTNPDVTRLFRNAPNTANPREINRWFARIEGAASRTPGMQADVDALKQALIGFANDNTAVRSAAAEPGGTDGNEQRAR